MGTWIEMSAYVIALPVALVVPYVGTWIEIYEEGEDVLVKLGRSLRGNVDRNVS